MKLHLALLALTALTPLAHASEYDIVTRPGQTIELPLPQGVRASQNYPSEVTEIRKHDGLALNVKSQVYDLDIYLVDSEGELKFKSVDLVNGKVLFDVTDDTGTIGVQIVAKKGIQLKPGSGYTSPETRKEYNYDPAKPVYVYEAAMPVGMTKLVMIRTK